MQRNLITGCHGQIGSELFPVLDKVDGADRNFGLDLKVSESPRHYQQDINDISQVEKIITLRKITTIYHLTSLLSVTSEADPQAAWQVNLISLKNILDLAVKYNLRVFWPSSIAAFGPTTPRVQTPQHTVLEPTTMYGVTKVAGELLCQYYFQKYHLDVRSLRYPGIISWKTPPGGGTTDYSVAMCLAAKDSGKYDCYLNPDTTLPMMYIDDAITATINLMSAPSSSLSVHTSYNLASFSLSPKSLASEISRHKPIAVSYSPDHRESIARSWPESVDDSIARHDWNWLPQFGLSRTVSEMLMH